MFIALVFVLLPQANNLNHALHHWSIQGSRATAIKGHADRSPVGRQKMKKRVETGAIYFQPPRM